ncbi:MAG: hypothetical protein FWD88_05390, partial [Treponema sp.]|nr:hypothetical protein [Treponema sp.]
MPETGINPLVAIPGIPRKQLLTSPDAIPTFVRVMAHVDVEKANPLNAGDYFFGTGNADDVPLFDYVVLGYAYLSRDAQGYASLELTPALRNVLDNNHIYLRPLTRKGIKVLIEVRSGRFSDDEDGLALGMGAMDMGAIREFLPYLGMLVERFGIDGFEFNDMGGGRMAYPPFTRNLKQFESEQYMYPDSLFQDADGNWLDDAAIERILWQEGASNFANLILSANEFLKARYRVSADFGSINSDNQTIEITRSIVVRNSGHGEFLPHMVRPAFTPDAYTGATPFIAQNLVAVVNNVPHDRNRPILYMLNETTGIMERQDPRDYSPFTVDLSPGNRLDAADARTLANWFAGTTASPNSFGTLYITGLPPVSEEPGLAGLLTNFTQPIFGRVARLYEGGGNRPAPQR